MALISDFRTKTSGTREAPGEPLSGRRFAGVSLLSWLALAAFSVLGAVLYGCTLGYPFHFDAQPYVIQNPLIRDFGSFRSYFNFPGIYRTIREHEMPADLATNFILRPVSYLTFWANYVLGGVDPRGYRLVNIALHAVNAFLVFQLLRRLTRSFGLRGQTEAASALFISMGPALLFLVHPLQVESVTYIAQRFTSLGTFFYLLAILLQFRSCDAAACRSRWSWRAAAVTALLLGMLSKEFCFTAPLMMVLLDVLVLGTPWRTSLRRTAPLLACMPLLPCLLLAAAGAMGNGHATLGDALRVAWPECQGQLHFSYALTEIRVIAVYLRLLLLPYGQNIDWGFAWTTSAGDWRVYGAATFLSAVVAGAWWVGRRKETDVRHRLLFASVLWYFLTLSVSSGLAPLPDALAEHRTYLASVGILTAVICLVDLLRMRRPGGLFARCAPAAVAMAVVLLCGATARRNLVWRSNITLWQDCVLKSPKNSRGWENLGIAFLQENKSEDACACLARAMELRPDDAEICKNFGAALVQAHRYPEALKVCHAALQFAKGDNRAGLHYDLALASLGTGQRPQAIRHLQDALSISPKHFLANLCLAGLYAEDNNRADALQRYQTAAVQYPEDQRVHAILSRIERIRQPKGG